MADLSRIPGIVFPRFAGVVLALLFLSGCQSVFHPRWTAPEKAILNFRVQGVAMESPPSHLTVFPQLKKDPPKPGKVMVYQVFNPNPHISTLIATYRQNRLKIMELRYFNGQGVKTLEISGGWEGLRQDLFTAFGPPSQFGPEVPVVATQGGLDPAKAQFNGVWIFSRVHRQLNYIAAGDEKAGVGIITVTDTTPQTKKQQKAEKPFPQAEPPPAATTPGPGFTTTRRFW
jgi:hypothetical protein